MGGVAAMAVILIAFNVLAGAFKERVDLTKEKAFTLSAGTRSILQKLDTSIKIRFYCSDFAVPMKLLNVWVCHQLASATI